MTDNENRNGYEYWNASWKAEGIQFFPIHSRIIEETKWNYFSKELPYYTGRSLEVGCGSGHFSALLAEAGFEAILLDYSRSAILCARNSFTSLNGRERKRYIIGDAMHLPITDGAIDVVLSCGTLEHFKNPLKPLQEMVRVLREGGLFYSDICPRKFTLVGMLSFLYKKKPGWYEARLSKSDIREMLMKAGLVEINIFSAGVLPPRDIPAKSRIRFIGMLESFLIERFKSFWISLDGTKIADWVGLYYFVTARKPLRKSRTNVLTFSTG